MKLFNEYENKTLQFLSDYINHIKNTDNSELSESELSNLLFGPEGNYSSPEISGAIFNHLSDDTISGLLYFHKSSDDKLVSIMDTPTPLPFRLTSYEKQWLKFILLDPKAKLFLSPQFQVELERMLAEVDTPISRSYLESNATNTEYSEHFVSMFKRILGFINNNHHPMVIYKESVDANNKRYISDEQQLIPYKIKYSTLSDSFSLLAWNLDTKQAEWIPLDDTINIDNGTIPVDDLDTPNYSDKYIKKLIQQIDHMRAKEPIVLCIYRGMEAASEKNAIRSNTMADDRFAYIFSDYNVTCHEDASGNLIASIQYYTYQYEEIISNILSLGKYVKVLGPDKVVDDIVATLKSKLANY